MQKVSRNIPQVIASMCSSIDVPTESSIVINTDGFTLVPSMKGGEMPRDFPKVSVLCLGEKVNVTWA